MKKTGLSTMEPYRVALEEDTPKKKGLQSSGKKPLTVDEREARENTYLEQVYGAQAQQDAAAHQSAVKTQERIRKEANRQAYIGSELMQKYLPQYQAAQGTGGMGTSSTEGLAAYNAYLGRVSANNAGFAQNVAALDQSKAERDAQREADLREAKYDAKSRYDYERQTMAETESAGLLDTMAGRKESYIGSDGKISVEDYENLLDFYEANEARLTEAGKRNAQDMLAEYKLAIRGEEEQAALDRMGFIDGKVRVTTAPTKYEPEKNLKMTDDMGRVYHAQIAGEVTDQTIKTEAAKMDSGEVFGYGGKLYLQNQGKVYEVEARTNSYKDSYANLYDLYFGREQGAQSEAVTIGNTVRAKNQRGIDETVTIGEKVTAPAYPAEYMEVGVIYEVNGERQMKDASGVVYKVK